MGRLNIHVKDGVESKFREEIFKRKGMKKGNLTKAVEEAMLLWMTAPTKNEQRIHKE